jgi:hypothetical protein
MLDVPGIDPFGLVTSARSAPPALKPSGSSPPGRTSFGAPGVGAVRCSATSSRIHFIPGLISFTMRWTNRSTFQQVIEFTGHGRR